MKREVRMTKDGSPTLFVESFDEHYHSIHGALQESLHVFIKMGLEHVSENSLSILEIGFGTGLNAWLTALKLTESTKVSYHAIEKYPVNQEEIEALNYDQLAKSDEEAKLFHAMHHAPWEADVRIKPNFILKKLKMAIENIQTTNTYNLIYFDAFAPSAQPELWTETIFSAMFDALKPGGTLVTYCAKGQVKRNMKAVGFTIERLPGPPGKREMTRATKPKT
jgi:tRNA U34 5-methylaminomethyl-2-thiouridine-forming methyltransferase MnmC